MTMAFVLLLILAATLLIGWVVTWLDSKHSMPLNQNQIRTYGLMVKSMKKYLDK